MTPEPPTPDRSQDAQKKNARGRPSKEAKDRRTSHRVMVNLNPADYEKAMAAWDPHVYPSRASYMRARLCAGEIKVRTWDQSLEAGLERLHEHNDLLRRIGVNLNQLVKHMNEHKSGASRAEVAQLARVVGECLRAQEASGRDLRTIAERYARS